MLKKIVAAIAFVLAVLSVIIIAQPDTYHIQRSTHIAATDAVVFAHINDLRAWRDWSPWERLDSNQVREYSAISKGKGAHYSWAGDKNVGKGMMTITQTNPDRSIDIDLHFIEPFEDNAKTRFEIHPSGQSVEVNWHMHGQNGFMGKAMTLMMNMDQMIGSDFEKGLAQLKAQCERQGRLIPPPAADQQPVPVVDKAANPE